MPAIANPRTPKHMPHWDGSGTAAPTNKLSIVAILSVPGAEKVRDVIKSPAAAVKPRNGCGPEETLVRVWFAPAPREVAIEILRLPATAASLMSVRKKFAPTAVTLPLVNVMVSGSLSR